MWQHVLCVFSPISHFISSFLLCFKYPPLHIFVSEMLTLFPKSSSQAVGSQLCDLYPLTTNEWGVSTWMNLSLPMTAEKQSSRGCLRKSFLSNRLKGGNCCLWTLSESETWNVCNQLRSQENTELCPEMAQWKGQTVLSPWQCWSTAELTSSAIAFMWTYFNVFFIVQATFKVCF